jgi:hypothetical protein
MKSQPHIPMSPSELPQQRMHEVVPPPARPPHFERRVGYGEFPDEAVPGSPRSPTLLVQVEWAQTPMNCGIEALYLQARRKHRVLWLRTYDDNWDRWDWQPIGYCPRKGIDRTAAASHLLLEYWKFTRELRDGGYVNRPFDWRNGEGLLSVADIRAIVRELNQKPEEA